jgi:carboxyl-terminal processing protease
MKITKKHVTNFVTLLLLCATWFAIGWIVRSQRLGPEIGLVEQVRQQLLSEYPGELPTTRELTYAAIRGMLRRVGDPHAALFEPVVGQRFQDDFAGRAGVIGLYPEKRDGQMLVGVVFPGEPADQAGLREGDVILAVDGVEFDEDTTSAEAILLIRGPVGTAAHFVVRRGEEILQFDPIRQERTIVSARMLPGEIAYVAQYTFTMNATQRMKEALDELLAQRPEGLIWDLRSNGGGSMEATQDILSYFIQDGLLFTVELEGGEQKQFVASGEGMATDIPLVVLVGERTYSAAEAAAAAIAERERGAIIGSQTYGKGTVQATIPLIQDCMLQMTVARWLSPTGQWYEGRGVTPDISATDDEGAEEDLVLQLAIDYILKGRSPSLRLRPVWWDKMASCPTWRSDRFVRPVIFPDRRRSTRPGPRAAS